MSIHPLSYTSLSIVIERRGKKEADASAFAYRRNGIWYLVTAWHCVSGTHFQTLKQLPGATGAPDAINVMVYCLSKETEELDRIAPKFLKIPLYQNGHPVWCVHSRYKQGVDVAVIPIGIDNLKQQVPAIHLKSPKDNSTDMLRFQVGSDLFILGYMFGREMFPIWKRASLATEPLKVTNGSSLYHSVDTSTRNGMSGSPVYLTAGATFQPEQTVGAGIFTAQVATPNANNHRFIGLYSGRRLFREKEEAQIGMVWPCQLIDEIIDFGVTDEGPAFWQPIETSRI